MTKKTLFPAIVIVFAGAEFLVVDSAQRPTEN